MTTTREAVLAALFAQIRDDAGMAGVDVLRNVAVPVNLDDVPAAGLVIITDGKAELDGQTLGHVVYFWGHEIPIEIMVPTGGETALAALVAAVDTALAADPSLGGRVDEMAIAEVEAAATDKEGLPEMIGAIMTLYLTYDTAIRTG